MNPKEILEEIKNFQINDPNIISKLIEDKNLRDNDEFNKSLIFLLNNDEVPIPQKLLIICFMKQYKIKILDFNDIVLIKHLLDINELKNNTSQLIVSNFINHEMFFKFLLDISDQSYSRFLTLLNTFIETNTIDDNLLNYISEVITKLHFIIQIYPLDAQLESVKCLISLANSISQNLVHGQIMHILFDCFMKYQMNEITMPIFFEILKLRHNVKIVDPDNFYLKIITLSEYVVTLGPPKNTTHSSLCYYISQMIFNIFEDYSNDLSIIPCKELVKRLILFTVNHEKQIKTWEYSIEDFFSDTEIYLLPNDKNGDIIDSEDDLEDSQEDNTNLIYKEPCDLQQYIYNELIKLGDIQIDQTTNLLSLATNTCISITGSTEFPNYHPPLINLSILFFFMNIKPIIQIDGEYFTNSCDEIGLIFYILYCAKKGIILNDISQKLEFCLLKESEMLKPIVASILINYNTEAINPILYSECFIQCLQILDSFNTERMTGIMKLLLLLADFEHKPNIVPGFSEKMEKIMEILINTLLLFQNAYQSTSSMCKIIAHFIHYVPFQFQLLPTFLNFINQLCFKTNYAILGIQLEYEILECKSARNSFNEDQISYFYQTFVNQLMIFNLEYLIENPSLVPFIILILNYFVKQSLINVADEYIFRAIACFDIPSHYFDKITPLLILLIKNEGSKFRFDILKILIERSQLLLFKFGLDSKISIDDSLLYPTIAVLAHLCIESPNDLKLLLEKLELNFNDILTAINFVFNFKNSFDIGDARVFLIMMKIYGNEPIIVDGNVVPMALANQYNTKNFFEKAHQLMIDNKFDELHKSSIYDREDPILSIEQMKCSFTVLLNWLIEEPADPVILEFKISCFQFLQAINQ